MEELVGLFKRSNKVTVISGAGLSTESGIPDYRGPNGSYSKGHKPMVHDEFMRSAYQRARYWARSMVGFERFGKALPNRGHEALVHLQQLIPQLNIITQNVDGLHQKAGSKEVIDLHGRIDTVICMDCHYKTTRRSHQQKLLALNRGWIDNNLGTRKQYTQLADGDVGLVDVDFDAYTVPVCDRCGGTLKPDVVFFGDNVPSSRVQKAFEWVRESNLVVAVGTSLMVYSGYRFALAARDLGIPIATVNYGSMTRVEKNKIPHVKVEGKCGEVLPQIVQKLRDR